MGKMLVVESPAKAKKIAKWLGPEWRVVASMGHVCDLPGKEIGVDRDAGFALTYVSDTRNKKAIAQLRSAWKDCTELYLAADPDREGESIAWHVARILRQRAPHRVTFNEITQKAITKALSQPRSIDMDQVRAQEARRAVDRLVGYRVSPALSRSKGARLSAGRVQSVAVRLVVERERAIENFRPETYFDVYLTFADSPSWKAKWDPRPYLPKTAAPICQDEHLARTIAAIRDVVVHVVETKKSARRPPPPFVTSTLQQAASVTLKIGAKETMQIAQRLYEAGHITYMRTDNPNLSDEAAQDVANLLGVRQLPFERQSWKGKASAQEAHEAIRPTDFAMERLTGGDPQQSALYRLIWMRAVASQMPASVYDVTSVELHAIDPIGAHHPVFRARGEAMVSPGWKQLTAKDHSDEKDDDGDSENQPLPTITQGAQLRAEKGAVEKKKTRPPARYTEASLIKTLESEGVGRPSTYASIMENIRRKGYIAEKQRKLHATEHGKLVVDALMEQGFSFVATEYTREMEADLDRVASGQMSYEDVVAELDRALSEKLEGLDAAPPVDTTHPCDCGGYFQKRSGKKGAFWGCSNFPECRETRNDSGDGPAAAVKSCLSEDYPCPCGSGYFQQRKGPSGVFWGCSNYPDCSETRFDDQGKPQTETEEDTRYPCECGTGHLRRRKGPRSWFWSCSSYPACRITRPDDKGAPGEKQAPAGEAVIGDNCPTCGEGKLMQRFSKGSGKHFLGCSLFPKCRHYSALTETAS